jgi:hypothetical protein
MGNSEKKGRSQIVNSKQIYHVRSNFNIEVKMNSGLRIFNSRSGAIIDLEKEDENFESFIAIWNREKFLLNDHK